MNRNLFGAATLVTLVWASACNDLLDIPQYRRAPSSTAGDAGRTGGTAGQQGGVGGAVVTGGTGANGGTGAMGGTGNVGGSVAGTGGTGTSGTPGTGGTGMAGDAGEAGAGGRPDDPCGLGTPEWTFDAGLEDFDVAWVGDHVGQANIEWSAGLGVMILSVDFDDLFDGGRDQEVFFANVFQQMNLVGQSVVACVRLLEPLDGPLDLPHVELFIDTGSAPDAGFSPEAMLSSRGDWLPIELDVNNPERTDGGLPISPNDVRGVGFRVFTPGFGTYGPVRIAVEAIAIQ